MVEYSIYANGHLIHSSTTPEIATVVSPKLKLEINKSGNLTFTMLPNSEWYDTIVPMKTLILVYQDDEIIFRGRVIEAKSDFYKQKNVTCESDLSFLLDSVMYPFEFQGSNKKTIRQIFKMIVDNHNSQMSGESSWKQFRYDDSFIDVTIDDNKTVNDVDDWYSSTYQDSISVLTNELLNAYGGVLRTRTIRENGELVTYLDYIKDPHQSLNRYSLNDQLIEFGVNLLDFDTEYPVDEIFSVLMPIGSDKLTIQSVNNGSPFIENQAAINRFGRIVKQQEWSDIKKAQELFDAASRYMQEHCQIMSDNLNIKAIDLHYLNPNNHSSFEVGDRIKVFSEFHNFGVDSDLILLCLSAEYDLQNPENNSYSIGTFIPSEKKKNRSSRKKTSGSRSIKNGGKVSATSLTSSFSSTEFSVDDVIQNAVDDYLNNGKGVLALVGDKALDLLGIKLPTVASVRDKVSAAVSGLGIGNNEGMADGTAIEDITDIFTAGQYTETKDPETGEITESSGIKNLSETTDDIVRIEGDVVQINARLVEINADIVQINADITEINSRTITIGSGEGSVITFDGDVNFTTAIENLIVSKLSAKMIESMTLSIAGRIDTRILIVDSTGYARVPTVTNYTESNPLSAINLKSLKEYVSGQLTNYPTWTNLSNALSGYSTTMIYDKNKRIIPNLDIETVWIEGHLVYIVAGT